MPTTTTVLESGIHKTDVRLKISGVVEGDEARKLEPWCQFLVVDGDQGGGIMCRDAEHAAEVQQTWGGEVFEVRR